MNGFINYVSFPKNAEELKNKLDEEGMTDIKLIFDGCFEWTISPMAKRGDLVLFYHTATALNNIKRVEEGAKKDNELYDYLKYEIEDAYKHYNDFGKAVFAIGLVGSAPELDEDAFDYETHYKERCFAVIKYPQILSHPVRVDKFSKFLDIFKQKSKDPIETHALVNLLKLIKEENSLSKELLKVVDKFLKENN